MPLVASAASAATTFIGTTNQQVNFGGVPQPVTGTFSLSGSTVQVVNSTVAVTNVSGQNLNVSVATPLPAGTNNIGTVSGSTVVVNQGGAGPFTENLTQVGGSAVSLGQKTSANSIPVVIASDQSSINVNANISGSTITVVGVAGAPVSVGVVQVATVNKSSQSVTTSSVQFFGSNTARRGFECVALPGNTDYVTCAWASTALTTDSVVITAYGSYEPPQTVIPTTAFSCIANSGTQVIRCTEYATP